MQHAAPRQPPLPAGPTVAATTMSDAAKTCKCVTWTDTMPLLRLCSVPSTEPTVLRNGC